MLKTLKNGNKIEIDVCPNDSSTIKTHDGKNKK